MTNRKLVQLALPATVISIAAACGSIKNDTPDGREFPVKGVIKGSVMYTGPAPCTQNGHVVGNAILLVFDRRNPPPPNGLANTAVNFVAVSGDVLFADWPRTQGSQMICPDPSTTTAASAPFTIAPMDPGSYVIEAFYDYTGDFLPTFKFRNLPEATDVGGGFIDINDATQPVQTLLPDGGVVSTQKQSDPNFQPKFLPVDVGIPGAVDPLSKRGVPLFTMPPNGYVADNVVVTIGQRLGLTRPYFYPQGVNGVPAYGGTAPFGSSGNPTYQPGQLITNPNVTVYGNDSSDLSQNTATPSNPNGASAYVPLLTFPGSLQVYAPPTTTAATRDVDVANQFQATFPQLRLNFGVPAAEQAAATDRINPADPFHMQLKPGAPQNGNGGIYVWWNGTDPDPLQRSIPEQQGFPRLWPLVVLAKLKDFRNPDGSIIPPDSPVHPDPQGLVAQGSDLNEPIVIIQAITLSEDSLLNTVLGIQCTEDTPGGFACSGGPLGSKVGQTATRSKILAAPDPSNLQDHVTALIRPSVLCLNPRHVDQGGTLVTPHFFGTYPPDDTFDSAKLPPGQTQAPVLDPASLETNPQLTTLLAGTPVEACMPPGRYGINVVYPDGQAWTAPNEMGRCAPSEGATSNSSDGSPGNCAVKSRPVLTSQGTRAVVEVLDDPGYCVGSHAVPDACTKLQ
jgi:hypothetical protein